MYESIRSTHSRAFHVADEMSKLYEKYSGNLDVAALYAESLMVLKPWKLWIKDTLSGEVAPANNSTLVAKSVLEGVSKSAEVIDLLYYLSRSPLAIMC